MLELDRSQGEGHPALGCWQSARGGVWPTVRAGAAPTARKGSRRRQSWRVRMGGFGRVEASEGKVEGEVC